MTNDRPDRADTITIPPLIYLAFFVVGFALDYVWPIAVLPQILQYGVGLAMVVLSGVIIAWTLPMFRRARTSFDVRKSTTVLITDGPFRFSRNPGYLALSLLYAGIAVIADSLWVLALLAPALFVMHYGVIAREELYLERKFGSQYFEYKARVRRWL